MRPHWLVRLAVPVLAAGTLPILSAQSMPADEQERLIGRWYLNLDKSTYSPGPPPTRETRTYVRDGDHIRGTIEREFADGRRERIEYMADYDREYPVVGTDRYDHVILKRIDAYTAEAVLSHAGRVFGTARRVITPDGRSMRITFRRDASSGVPVHNVAVYDKLDPPDTEGR